MLNVFFIRVTDPELKILTVAGNVPEYTPFVKFRIELTDVPNVPK